MTYTTRPQRAALPAALLLLVLAGCTSEPSDTAGTPDPAQTAEDPGGPGADDDAGGEREPGAPGEGLPEGIAALIGVDVADWAEHLAGVHGVNWTESGVEITTSEGTGRLRWQTETREGEGGLRLSAEAFTDSDGRATEINCTATDVPDFPAGQWEFLADCVTAAGVEGVERRAAEVWVTDAFASLGATDRTSRDTTVIGGAEITASRSADTASVVITAP
ncbi:hypothetical protein [Streptomyces spiramenti]|uniref:Lipoprotein n=1 Tax=Streptomyces spiramenti TaxID=2720606 RepID=A0ABX1ALJ0_9ACTN|nr:hypothetical protein [Streptomyces spiramenti]NJP66694.1 hypothetical protein [Streptomyces spiramenti]